MGTKSYTTIEQEAISSIIEGNTYMKYSEAIISADCNNVEFCTSKLICTHRVKGNLIIVFEKSLVLYNTPNLKLMKRYDAVSKIIKTKYEEDKVQEYIKNNKDIRYRAREIRTAVFDTKKGYFIDCSGNGMFDEAVYSVEFKK